MKCCCHYRNIQWEKDGSSDTVTLEYPYISVHGISTETSNFAHQCVFCLVDAVLPGKIVFRHLNYVELIVSYTEEYGGFQRDLAHAGAMFSTVDCEPISI